MSALTMPLTLTTARPIRISSVPHRLLHTRVRHCRSNISHWARFAHHFDRHQRCRAAVPLRAILTPPLEQHVRVNAVLGRKLRPGHAGLTRSGCKTAPKLRAMVGAAFTRTPGYLLFFWCQSDSRYKKWWESLWRVTPVNSRLAATSCLLCAITDSRPSRTASRSPTTEHDNECATLLSSISAASIRSTGVFHRASPCPEFAAIMPAAKYSRVIARIYHAAYFPLCTNSPRSIRFVGIFQLDPRADREFGSRQWS